MRAGTWGAPVSPFSPQPGANPCGLTFILAIPSCGNPVPLGHPTFATGVTTGSTLDGITSPPEHFPPGHPDLPDIVFFYR